MRYDEALSFLYSFVSYEQSGDWKYSSETFDLSGYRQLLSALGNPQWSYRTVHIAGSDGKGSVAAMLATVLREAGLRVGLYTSPHLHDLRERITIDGIWIPKRSLAAIVTTLREHLGVYGRTRRGFATFFDLLTAAAFVHFARSKVDIAIIETGLGGRLDATNVLKPEATIITHLSLEHTDKLGNTLEKIAAEKLAIAHPGTPCLVAPQRHKILPFIRTWLRERNVPATFVQKKYVVESGSPQRNRRSVVVSGAGRRRQITLNLLGSCQPENAATVCATVDALRERWHDNPRIGEESIGKGLRSTEWPGRLEILHGRKTGWPVTVVLDVAHTERGAASLRRSLAEVFGERPRVMVLGFLQGKNVLGIVRHLIRRGDTLVCTHAPSPRGIPVAELRGMLECRTQKDTTVEWCDNPSDALALARESAGRDKLVVVAGSLYLVGHCREILLK
ncbi:MAG: folylpolyglutamate synthase/dihydrofolate synthase family protein [bacterium]